MWPLERATGMAALYVPAAEPFGNGLQIRRNTVGERFPGVQCAQACPIVSLSRCIPLIRHARPMPLMTSSRMNSAPYLSQTDFMALK